MKTQLLQHSQSREELHKQQEDTYMSAMEAYSEYVEYKVLVNQLQKIRLQRLTQLHMSLPAEMKGDVVEILQRCQELLVSQRDHEQGMIQQDFEKRIQPVSSN